MQIKAREERIHGEIEEIILQQVIQATEKENPMEASWGSVIVDSTSGPDAWMYGATMQT